MAELKTKPTKVSVTAFLNKVTNAEKRKDCDTLVKLMGEVTGEKPKMWGPSIVGFGSYHYVYASGRGGDWPLTGFAPRKDNLVLYIMAGFKRYDSLLAKLGKHKTGKACLYVKRLSDIDPKVLRELVQSSVQHMREHASCK